MFLLYYINKNQNIFLNMSIKSNCPICLLSLEPRQIKAGHHVLLPRGGSVAHDFHKECIELCFQTTIRAGQIPTCPVCRAPAAVFDSIEVLSDLELRELAFLQEVDRDEQMLQELEMQEIANQRALKELLVDAIVQGNLEVIQTHLDIGEIADEDRGFFLQVAAKYDHKDIVLALLANGCIPLSSRYQAIKEAISQGHLHLLQDLLPLVPLAILSLMGLSLAYLRSLQIQEERG